MLDPGGRATEISSLRYAISPDLNGGTDVDVRLCLARDTRIATIILFALGALLATGVTMFFGAALRRCSPDARGHGCTEASS